MGAIIDELDDHEGYALWRLSDGTVVAAGTQGVREVTAYVAGCECGWQSHHQHPPTEEGQEAAYEQWEREHALGILGRRLLDVCVKFSEDEVESGVRSTSADTLSDQPLRSGQPVGKPTGPWRSGRRRSV
jgi:hypothetical protein